MSIKSPWAHNTHAHRNSLCSVMNSDFLAALRIHISQSTADILLKMGSYELVVRGEVELKVYTSLLGFFWWDFLCASLNFSLCHCSHKGKGLQKTYWLNSKVGLKFPPTPQHCDSGTCPGTAAEVKICSSPFDILTVRYQQRRSRTGWFRFSSANSEQDFSSGGDVYRLCMNSSLCCPDSLLHSTRYP